MKHFLPATVLISLISQPLLAADCIDEKDVIGVTLSSESIADQKQYLSILRETNSRVIYDFQPQGITRVYLRYSEENIGYEEYFNLEEIGVEHEPSPTNVPGGWSEVSNFVSADTLESLKKTSSGTHQCLTTNTYEGVYNGETIKAVLIDNLNLPILLERRTATGGNRWEVEALEIDPQRISSISSKLDTYRTYDFADLGDHEEEAFFRNSGYLKYKLGHDREGDHDH